MDLQSAIARYNRLAESEGGSVSKALGVSACTPVEVSDSMPTLSPQLAAKTSTIDILSTCNGVEVSSKDRRIAEAKMLAKKYAALLQYVPGSVQSVETIQKAVKFYSFSESRLAKFRTLIASFE